MTNKIQRLAKVSAVVLSTFGLVANTAFAQTLPAGTNGDTLRHNGTDWVTSTEVKNYGIDGVVATGTLGSGNIPSQGTGTRMMWYPAKAAFRAGRVDAAQWDNSNVGNYSVVFGQNGIASGNHAIALGDHNVASGSKSVAIGDGNTASGAPSWAIGSGNNTSGTFSSAFGVGNTAIGSGAMVFGTYNTANGHYSTAMGRETKVDTYLGVATGRFNVGGGNSSNWVGSDSLFEVGIGTSNTARANAFTVLKNGNVGVGTHTPAYKLDVSGHTRISGQLFTGQLAVSSGEINLRPYTNMLVKESTPVCDSNKVGTIAFFNDTFNGCTSQGWTSMNMGVVKQ